MAEYIKEQTLTTSITNSDWLVFDTLTATYRITRGNLLGQMDTNAADIAQNESDIADNAAAIAINAADIATNESNIATLEAVGIKAVTVEITAPQLADLFASPITLVSLAGAAYVYVIDAVVDYRYSAAPYTSGGDLLIESGTYLMGSVGAGVYTAGTNMIAKMNAATPAAYTTGADLTIRAASSNPTTGSGAMKVTIIYKLMS